jgi:hypothetical protein
MGPVKSLSSERSPNASMELISITAGRRFLIRPFHNLRRVRSNNDVVSKFGSPGQMKAFHNLHSHRNEESRW